MAEERDFRKGELPEKYIVKCCIGGMMESLRRMPKKVGEELAKMEISFFREEILKRK